MDIVRLHTMWFITAWLKTHGDLKAVKEQALKELPNGDDDLMRIMAKDREYVKLLLYPDRATVPAVSTKSQDHGAMAMPQVATRPLPMNIPAPANVPKKAANVRRTLGVPPPVPPHAIPVRKRSQTLLTMPKGAQDFDRLGVPSTLGATQVKKVVEAKAVEVTQDTTMVAPQKAVLTNVMADSKFEMPEVKGNGEGEEQEEIDVSHESMVCCSGQCHTPRMACFRSTFNSTPEISVHERILICESIAGVYCTFIRPR